MCRPLRAPSFGIVLHWTVHHSRGSAAAFHERDLIPIGDVDPAEGMVHVHHSTRRALVFGSAQQPELLIDVEAAMASGWDVCRRRSGGGLVVVVPDAQVWIDLVIPAAHPLWSDDVNRAFDWVGAAWLDAIEALGLTSVDRHVGGLQDRDAGRVLCFAGLGPGEVETVDRADRRARKLVGLSQRRTRHGARFQTMLALSDTQSEVRPFAGSELRHLLDRGDRRPVGWPDTPHPPDPATVSETFVAGLPRSSTTAS